MNLLRTSLIASLTFLAAAAGFSPTPVIAARAAAKAPAGREAARSPLPFIADDYPQALARARALEVPIFVETWAPWCHTCRSMRAFVLNDPSLAKHADEFVWLEIDTENARNASFRKQYPIQALPTMLIVDPNDEQVVLRWVGAATLPQLEALLRDGRNAAARPEAGFEAVLARADRLYGEARYTEAVPAFRDVLAQAASDWPGRPRTVESLLFALSNTGAHGECARLARAALPGLGRTTAGASAAGSGLGCALGMPADSAGRSELVAALETTVAGLVADRSVRMADDDRSGLYGALYDARQDAKDEAGARKIAQEWAAFLEGAAAGARTPDQRATFDSHRLGIYLELDEPERAIQMLEASERDLPDDYNPPARLAAAYRAMKRWPQALAAADRALAKAYGPRKIRILRTRADVYKDMGDSAAARRALEETLSYAESLPTGQRSEATIAELKKLMALAP